MNATDAAVVIVDYGMGNVCSIANMLKKVRGNAIISGDPEVVARARRIILPGVGAFDNGMSHLESRGLLPVLHRKAMEERVPILGICLGMQLLGRHSEEGSLPGLGWVHGESRRFRFPESQPGLRIPHMGWNTVTVDRPHGLFADGNRELRFYFAHSYHLCCANPGNVLCTTVYGDRFTSAVASDNIVGVQFHPEKSHSYGMRLLSSFLER